MDPFAAIADPVRRGLLEQLSREGPTRVVDLTAGRGISRPAVSRHLRVLAGAGLVRAAQRGRERHFELVPGPLEEVASWVRAVRPSTAPVAAPPPVSAHQLDALDLEVRRTVRERQPAAGSRQPRETGTTDAAPGESA